MDEAFAVGSLTVDIVFEKGSLKEQLVASSLGARQYRVEAQPIFADDISYFDVIEAEPQADGSLRFLRVIEKSSFKTDCYVLHEQVIESEQFKKMLDNILTSGGN